MHHLASITVLSLVLSCFSNSSDMQISLKDGSFKTYSLDVITSIKFTTSAVSVNGKDAGTYESSDIRKITFVGNSLNKEDKVEENLKTPLFTASPNPFNPTTKFYINSKIQYMSSIDIYDCSGSLVKKLKLMTDKESLFHTAVWNGCNNEGKQVASGTYVAVLKSGKNVLKTKVLLSR
ncbi:MAG: T9SS type A sorting domain-containing protein [Fibrobacteres bacterium]|nr:T9SS type A sorting domain-containing protein [Fibrobacterota bacterium]